MVTAVLFNSSKCELDRIVGTKQEVEDKLIDWLRNITDGDTIEFFVDDEE